MIDSALHVSVTRANNAATTSGKPVGMFLIPRWECGAWGLHLSHLRPGGRGPVFALRQLPSLASAAELLGDEHDP